MRYGTIIGPEKVFRPKLGVWGSELGNGVPFGTYTLCIRSHWNNLWHLIQPTDRIIIIQACVSEAYS